MTDFARGIPAPASLFRVCRNPEPFSFVCLSIAAASCFVPALDVWNFLNRLFLLNRAFPPLPRTWNRWSRLRRTFSCFKGDDYAVFRLGDEARVPRIAAVAVGVLKSIFFLRGLFQH